jgi:hypothetical protein
MINELRRQGWQAGAGAGRRGIGQLYDPEGFACETGDSRLRGNDSQCVIAESIVP